MGTYVLVKSAAEFEAKFASGATGARAEYEGPGLYNKKTGYQMDMPQRDEVCAPMVMLDIPEHVTPHGTVVSSRSTRSEYCKRNDFSPYERVKSRPRGYANEKFAKKRGLKISEAAQEHMASEKKTAFKKAGWAT